MRYCGLWEYAQNHPLWWHEAVSFVSHPETRCSLLEIDPYPELGLLEVWITKDYPDILRDFLLGEAFPICWVPDRKWWLTVKLDRLHVGFTESILLKLLELPRVENHTKTASQILRKAKVDRKMKVQMGVSSE